MRRSKLLSVTGLTNKVHDMTIPQSQALLVIEIHCASSSGKLVTGTSTTYSRYH